MQNEQISDTQPSRTTTRPVRVSKKSKRKAILFGLAWALLASIVLGAAAFTGGLAGYRSGNQVVQDQRATQNALSLDEQYQLAMQDLSKGRYEVARQRFEFLLDQNPAYPGAKDGLVQAMSVLFATATPTPVPPTVAPTPTRDLRPVQNLLAQAQTAIANQDWSAGIDTLTNLRAADPAFQVTLVDRLLYIALRNRGVDKIYKQSDLEGGTYDLALAERFGPLDAAALQARNLARMYMYGSAFWEAYPEQAVYYFGQVAAAAPYLSDLSGWTARERYRQALITYGDALAQGEEWCPAQQQYDLALSIRDDATIQTTASYLAEQCSPPTNTPLPPTPTATPTLPLLLTPTDTPPPLATATETPATTSPPANPTATETPTLEPTAGATETLPTQTPTNTLPPAETPTNTPPPQEPTATDTQQPTEQPSLEPTATLTPAPAVMATNTPERAVDTPTPTATPTEMLPGTEPPASTKPPETVRIQAQFSMIGCQPLETIRGSGSTARQSYV